jgi:lipopolysaccharide/colanic/teichoic acid biosynthesis glycosyltransferase
MPTIDETMNKTLAMPAKTDGVVEHMMKRKPLAYRVVKRGFDVAASLMGIVLSSPIMAAAAIMIKANDGGPVIHTRICQGAGGRTYKMYKFRTMVMDADNLERWMSPEQIGKYISECKLDEDPRVTKPGRFLRKTSIDELPQLFSVLKGDMSLIGPRPVVPREAEAYGTDKELLLSVKPGITGWWQVNARGDMAYLSEEAKSLQLYYAKHCSLLLDIKIMFMTVGVVLSGRGAK